jgi:hypothetical protein
MQVLSQCEINKSGLSSQIKQRMEKQIGIKLTREGISSRQPAGQVEGEQQEGRARKAGGTWEELQRHHNMKPEQDDVRNMEWELHHHCGQARQKAKGCE